jgi:hypothetical protein
MTVAQIACLLLFVLAAGCIGVERAPPPAAPQPGRAQEEAVAVEPVVSPPAPPENYPAGPGAVKTEAPAAEAPARIPAPKVAAPKKESPAPVAKKPASPPPLDLAALERGLKETDAIGVFTKLTLKNQVDDLLERFRAYYQGREKTSLAELRQPYDTLISKVLALLQDDDPPLARALVASREAIWGILSDPVRFNAL